MNEGASASQVFVNHGFQNNADYGAGAGNAGWQPNSRPIYQHSGPFTALKSGLAIASMVVGIAAFPTSIVLVGFLLAPVAVTLGIIALVKASRNPMVYGGKGFAIAGVATGSLTLLFLPIVAAIAIPNVLAAKRAANEGSAISALRTLYGAEQTFKATSGRGDCGDLSSLQTAGLIDPKLASGTRNEYRFEVIISGPSRGCELFATPISTSGGTRSFMVSNDGIVRGAKKLGLKADKYDQELGN